MVKTCPYCGEQKSALKNHVRLTSGGGHGPSGQYPDGFEPSTEVKNSSTSATHVGESEGGGGDTPPDLPPDSGGGDDGGRTSPEPSADGSGTVTVEAVEETEEPQDLPEFDEDGEEAEERIVAMPESKLNEMTRSTDSTASEAVSGGDGGGEEERSTNADEEHTSVEAPSLDPDDVAEEADGNGRGSGTLLVLLVLGVIAGSVWGIQDLAGNGQQQAQQSNPRADPEISVV